MKPAWDELMSTWNTKDRLKGTLIADVDCDGKGKTLCKKQDIRGYPALKWGFVDYDGGIAYDPLSETEGSALEEYSGDRDYASLAAFVKANITRTCTASDIDVCDADQKVQIKELQTWPSAELAERIEERQKLIDDAEASLKGELDKLREKYAELDKIRTAVVDRVKPALKSLLAVRTYNKLSKDDYDSDFDTEPMHSDLSP